MVFSQQTYVDEGAHERIYFPALEEYFTDAYAPSDEPFVYDELMVEARKTFIQQLLPEQIVSVEQCGEVWYDDHLPCVAATIVFTSGDVMSISFVYLEPEEVGMFKYSDSPLARADIIKYMQNTVEDM